MFLQCRKTKIKILVKTVMIKILKYMDKTALHLSSAVCKSRDLRDKTIADNILNNNIQNKPFCRLQLVVETFRYST